MQQPSVDITLILVSYHSLEPLQRFFASLRRHPIRARHEILVIDNAPGDGTAGWIAEHAPEARVLSMSGNVGYARAVNAGIEEGRGRSFLVINPDVELSEGAVDRALAYLDAHDEVGVVGARLLNADGSLQRSARRFYTILTILLRRTPLGKLFPRHPALRRHLMLDDDLEQPRPVDWVMGAWMLARREAIESVGPMDGRFFLYFEDVDWCYRMWAGGYEVHYLPDSCFVHQYQRSSGRISRTLLHHLRSFLSFYDKWGALVYVAKRMRRAWEMLTAFLLDVLCLNVAFLGAYFVRRALDPIFPLPLFDLGDYLPLLAFVNLVAAITLPMLGRYRRPPAARRLTRWLDATRFAMVVTLVVMAGTFLSHTRTFSRAVILLLLPLHVISLELSRHLRLRFLAGGGSAASEMSRALLLGPAAEVEFLADRLREENQRLVVAGAISPGVASSRLRRIGTLETLDDTIESYHLSEVLVASSSKPDEATTGAVRELAASGVPVLLSHPWAQALGGAEGTVARYGQHWWKVEPPAACREGAWLKHLLDRPMGLILFLLSLPGFVLCSLLGRPLGLVGLGRVTRLGQRRQALSWSELVWKRNGRPLWGGVQLPLFFQVLAGRLSLVGPYPLPIGFEEELGPIQLLRFAVKPGLSGLWQQRLEERSLRQLVSDDLEYLEHWSLTLDLDLFLSALPKILASRDRMHWVPTAT